MNPDPRQNDHINNSQYKINTKSKSKNIIKKIWIHNYVRIPRAGCYRTPRLMRVWETSRLTSNASLRSRTYVGLSNLTSYLKCGSEEPSVSHGSKQPRSYFKRGSAEPRVLRGLEELHLSHFARVWATPHSDWDTDVECHVYTVTRGPCSARDPRFYYNWPMGQLTLHVIGELIPLWTNSRGHLNPPDSL